MNKINRLQILGTSPRMTKVGLATLIAPPANIVSHNDVKIAEKLPKWTRTNGLRLLRKSKTDSSGTKPRMTVEGGLAISHLFSL